MKYYLKPKEIWWWFKYLHDYSWWENCI